eukprot:TRINITY_DN25258_c0_g2_i1.p1 TRINITY_DN25258_c0_g2~~TRINITY_DN25258_c0_g2_i1.p1  ORF type:complete len:907 (+),score=231.12 TRINITY_DN25258_c0_g2_i1:601-3321(+)
MEDLDEQDFARWLEADSPEALHGFCAEARARLYGAESRFPIRLEPLANEPETPATAWRRQLSIERETQHAAVMQYRAVLKKMEAEGRSASLSSQQRVWVPWVKEIALQIHALRELKDDGTFCIKPTGHGRVGDALLQEVDLEPDLLGVITADTLLNLVYTFRKREQEIVNNDRTLSVPFVTAVVAVGEAVELEAAWREECRRDGRRPMPRDRLVKVMRRVDASCWSKRRHVVPIGAALVDRLLSVASIEVNRDEIGPEVPWEEVEAALEQARRPGSDGGQNGRCRIHAFARELMREGVKQVSYVSLRPTAHKHMDISAEDLTRIVLPKHQPMVAEPLSWRPSGEYSEGCYLLHGVPFIRTANNRMTHLRTYCPERVCNVMDIVGRTPWRVNRRVLQVMEDVVERDLALAEVPPRDDPVVPAWPENYEDLPQEEKSTWKIKIHNARKQLAELTSERPTFQLKLQVARDFANAQRIFFPHNVDFRGRTYPIPPHLNHIGNDVCRGLLCFAESRPLGKDGLFWLKVNLANLLGKDKLPFLDRVAYVDGLREEILRVADDPLDEACRDLWVKASDGPWQALARCFELAEIWRSGDEEGFQSCLPVHLDGSCNGLQHYAAIGRDEWGANAVNLTPSDRPQDVYTVVLNIVKEKVRKQCESENEEQRAIAQRLESLGLLQRKVVKRTVMTICYGVTSLGAKAQVQGEIEDMVGNVVEPQEIVELAKHLSKLVLQSIDEVFERAMRIKKWLDKLSGILNQLESPVSWLSPAGLACVQPYKKAQTVQVRTKSQKVNINDRDGPLVNKSKQRMGFPPNFIHSLDATHMMLTAEACHKRGIVFAGVHDSFWTHAGDATMLQEVIRDCFIELHDRPILQELYDDLRRHVGGIAELPPPPTLGDLDLNRVRESTYIFS